MRGKRWYHNEHNEKECILIDPNKDNVPFGFVKGRKFFRKGVK